MKITALEQEILVRDIVPNINSEINLQNQPYMHQNTWTSGFSESPTCFGTLYMLSSVSPPTS